MSLCYYRHMKTLEILCNKLFDYAGTFPPASLSFDEALKTTSSFTSELSRPHLVAVDLVTPVVNLAKIDSALLERTGVKQGRRFLISALVSELGEKSGKLSGELLAIKAFNASLVDASIPIQTVAVECRLSKYAQEDPASLHTPFDHIRDTLAGENIRLFLELDCSASRWVDELRSLCTALQRANSFLKGSVEFGVKVRGGGPTGVTNEKLAIIIPLVTEFNLPFKATSGLHHPIIETQPYGEANKLGFINLTMALMLSRALPGKFKGAAVERCLEGRSVRNFTFTDSKAGFEEFVITGAELQSAKKLSHFSIGSCSINEPDDDLVRLFGEPR